MSKPFDTTKHHGHDYKIGQNYMVKEAFAKGRAKKEKSRFQTMTELIVDVHDRVVSQEQYDDRKAAGHFEFHEHMYQLRSVTIVLTKEQVEARGGATLTDRQVNHGFAPAALAALPDVDHFYLLQSAVKVTRKGEGDETVAVMWKKAGHWIPFLDPIQLVRWLYRCVGGSFDNGRALVHDDLINGAEAFVKSAIPKRVHAKYDIIKQWCLTEPTNEEMHTRTGAALLPPTDNGDDDSIHDGSNEGGAVVLHNPSDQQFNVQELLRQANLREERAHEEMKMQREQERAREERAFKEKEMRLEKDRMEREREQEERKMNYEKEMTLLALVTQHTTLLSETNAAVKKIDAKQDLIVKNTTPYKAPRGGRPTFDSPLASPTANNAPAAYNGNVVAGTTTPTATNNNNAFAGNATPQTNNSNAGAGAVVVETVVTSPESAGDSVSAQPKVIIENTTPYKAPQDRRSSSYSPPASPVAYNAPAAYNGNVVAGTTTPMANNNNNAFAGNASPPTNNSNAGAGAVVVETVVTSPESAGDSVKLEVSADDAESISSFVSAEEQDNAVPPVEASNDVKKEEAPTKGGWLARASRLFFSPGAEEPKKQGDTLAGDEETAGGAKQGPPIEELLEVAPAEAVDNGGLLEEEAAPAEAVGNVGGGDRLPLVAGCRVCDHNGRIGTFIKMSATGKAVCQFPGIARHSHMIATNVVRIDDEE